MKAVKIKSLQQNSWSWMLRNLILPAGDLLFGQKMMRRLRFLEQAQWWEPEDLAQARDQALRQMIQVAGSEVPLYRELMEQAGMRPEEISSAEDLARLPIVTKDILRANYPARVTRSTGQKTYQVSTSGSTGKNFFLMEDPETAGWYRASFLLALEWAGWQIGEPHIQTGMTTSRGLDRKLKDFLLQCHYVSAFNLSDPHLEAVLELIDRYKVCHVFGYPASIYWLARCAQKNGWNGTLNSTVTWGDMLFPRYRQTIEAAFHTQVFDTYGCAEGIQIAAQCEHGKYHLHVLDGIVEFVDENGSRVKRGDTGSILVTRLHPGPMPLIRYKIGDLGAEGETSACPCGRGFGLLASILGREADTILTPTGNRLIVHFFTGILEFFPEIDTFQAVQEENDLTVLYIVPRPDFSSETARLVIAALKDHGAADMEFRIELVETISLSHTGKRRFVISKTFPNIQNVL